MSDEVKVEVEDLVPFYVSKSEPLLNSLEEHDIRIEYQCRSGYCGACRVTLLEGRVDYDEPPLAFIKENEILTCCCKAITDLKIMRPL
ncbi:class I ribonucleotide reductase maintenance protein YfaE [Litoribacillus peritrichatus]|uniref:Class I ribonucleotide reductase maintenance protein YfaE n=1 Tax=Litoribacillus peritrichatus TaxID=718191 RepID=A0ABP7MG23_9GAMM